MRLYLAAPYAVRDHLRSYARELESMGHISTASWIWAEHEIKPDTLETAPALSDDYAALHSVQDMEEVLDSDCLLLVTWPTALALNAAHSPHTPMGGNSGGRHVETGIALGSNIPVVVWGEPENIFHRGLCTIAHDWEGVLEHLEVVQAARFGHRAPSVQSVS